MLMLIVTGTAMVVPSMCVGDGARGVGASLGSCRVELELEEGDSGYLSFVVVEPDRVVFYFDSSIDAFC